MASCGNRVDNLIASTLETRSKLAGFVVFGSNNRMPNAAPKPCNHPGCGVLVRDGSGRCAKHPRAAWAKAPTATKRITGRKLQALREALFSRSPLCMQCEAEGRVTLATQRDHIVSLEQGGADDDDNTQALCLACHDIKSKGESAHARAKRWAGGGSKV